jgi:hypothetical protein
MSFDNSELQPLRVSHVTSSSGNIGDNSNHKGLQPWFEEQFGRFVVWTRLEISEFYWKERWLGKSEQGG